jgi:hypothetical protein
MIPDPSISSRVVSYKIAQQVGKAIIAVGVREEEGTESRCWRGGDSERRYRFGGLSAGRSGKFERTCFARSVEEPRAEVATIDKWVSYVDGTSGWAAAEGALDVLGTRLFLWIPDNTRCSRDEERLFSHNAVIVQNERPTTRSYLSKSQGWACRWAIEKLAA